MAMLLALAAQATDYTQYVNPLIGTQTDSTGALSGSTFPGPTMPQGMVQLSPETEQMVTWDPCCGYDYDKDQIYGFTHTHLSGTGCTDLIDVSLMPWTGEVSTGMLARGEFPQHFSHDEEVAKPGFYSVLLRESGVRAELSATVHAGIHRYTYPQGARRQVILDLNRSTYRGDDAYYIGKRGYNILQSQMRVVDSTTIEGYRIMTGWAKLRHVYFRAEFSQPITGRVMMDGQRLLDDVDVMNGRALKALLQFDGESAQPLTVKVSISAVDSKGARQNMLAEAQSWDFDHYVTLAHDAWERELGRIDIQGTDEQKTIFYTGLYHVLMQPNVISDVDGRYRNTNYEVCQMPQGEQYHSTFSLWDTFRAAHPLYTLLCPDVAAQFVRDMVRHQQSYGYLPIWDLWGQENYCMIGNHAIPVLSDAILAGLPGIDQEATYRAMVESSTRPHANSPFGLWEKYGYMPQNLQGTSVSITLEQAFDDWCVAQVAKRLGHMDDYERFARRAMFYKNLYDPHTGFFRPKDDQGRWIEPFDPLSYEQPCFIEGNAWQYMWFVPQDPQGLISLMGGREAFLKKLDENFTLTATSGERNGNASGFIGQYAHGNEPSHHTVYLYTMAGKPSRTEELVEQVRTSFYNATPCGYAGNDDCGQMSAWYIFSSLGFYPFNAGSAEYVIGTPLFTEATLHLAGGHDFTIKARGKRDGQPHVKSVRLNGKRLRGHTLTHQQIMAGDTLEFTMR